MGDWARARLEDLWLLIGMFAGKIIVMQETLLMITVCAAALQVLSCARKRELRRDWFANDRRGAVIETSLLRTVP